MLAAQKAEKAQHGEGEEAAIFFFFLLKLKLPEKRKCCPYNFGRDFQLLFPLSEGQISSPPWEEERGRAVAQKPGMCQGPEKEEEEDGQGEDNQRRKKEHQKRL